MSPNNIITKVEHYLRPILVENNCELFDLVFVKEGPNWFLRIFIDKDGGVNIDDCEAVSRAIEVVLDKENFITQSYILEVSSPGIDRPLKNKKDFEKYKGESVDIKLYKAIGKRKEFSGELIGLSNNEISIQEHGKIIKFNKDDVSVCKLSVLF